MDKEKVGIREKELFHMEVEAECDRQNLCQKIIAHVDQQVQNHLNSSIALSEQAVTPAVGKKDRDNKTP